MLHLGRKKKDDTAKADARERLLEAALTLFTAHGFEGVSTRMLAQEGGVNIAMISYYFKSKEGLFFEVMEQKLPQTRNLLAGIRDNQSLSNWQKVTSVVEVYIERILHNNSFTRLILIELGISQRGEQSRILLEGLSQNWDIMLEIFVQGQRDGEFNADFDAPLMLSTFISSLFQLAATPQMSIRMLHLEHQQELFTPAFKSRVKDHLLGLLGATMLKKG